jgi:hypothetical protein
MRFCLVSDASYAEVGGEIGIISSGDCYAVAMLKPLRAEAITRVAIVPPSANEPRYATPGMSGVVLKVTPMPDKLVTRIDFLSN